MLVGRLPRRRALDYLRTAHLAALRRPTEDTVIDKLLLFLVKSEELWLWHMHWRSERHGRGQLRLVLRIYNGITGLDQDLTRPRLARHDDCVAKLRGTSHRRWLRYFSAGSLILATVVEIGMTRGLF